MIYAPCPWTMAIFQTNDLMSGNEKDDFIEFNWE